MRAPLTCICLSDTHGQHNDMPTLPDGDVLIHAGDCLGTGSVKSFISFAQWFESQPHRHKILVAGNHDRAISEQPELIDVLLPTTHYLEDSGVEINGFKFWGSPWTPTFHHWHFMLDRGVALKERWDLIPEDTDVLVTHGPPQRIGDAVSMPTGIQYVGCEDLLTRTDQLSLKTHVFGHIHEGYGQYVREGRLLINASTCTENYEPINSPIIFELRDGEQPMLSKLSVAI